MGNQPKLDTHLDPGAPSFRPSRNRLKLSKNAQCFYPPGLNADARAYKPKSERVKSEMPVGFESAPKMIFTRLGKELSGEQLRELFFAMSRQCVAELKMAIFPRSKNTIYASWALVFRMAFVKVLWKWSKLLRAAFPTYFPCRDESARVAQIIEQTYYSCAPSDKLCRRGTLQEIALIFQIEYCLERWGPTSTSDKHTDWIFAALAKTQPKPTFN